MAAHERFNFRSLAELRAKIEALGLSIVLDEDISPIRRQIAIESFKTPNALGVHPMEGCDGKADGSPDELTIRRYERFATGGAGLLWFEATAVTPEGRANPRQLWLHESNVREFAQLVRRTDEIARRQFGTGHSPLKILQLTHSGRYCRPIDKPAPVIAFHHPVLDAAGKLPAEYPVISDDQLETLENRYAEVAKLAREAGFDGVDIKSTHGYLIAELLAGHTRPGRYGGSFENRTRFLLNIVEKARAAAPDLLLAVRLGVCDCLDYPYGWGVDREVRGKEDMDEPIRLVRSLYAKGVRLLNCTAGNPYYNAHVTRPFDQNITRSPMEPTEHPLEGIDRLFRTSRAIQLAVPKMVVVNTGYSWLRQFFPYAAAANIRRGWTAIAGVGRLAFANPSFARDLMEKGELDPRTVCTACSKCTQLMRDGGNSGCVTRDSQIYLPLYRQYCRPA